MTLNALRLPLSAALLTALAALAPSAPAAAANPAPAEATAGTACAQTSFRIRSDLHAPLDADAGWAAEEGAAAVIQADRPFRIRFEVEAGPQDTGARYFELQYRRNGGEWEDVEAGDFPYPFNETPPVSTVSTPAYGNGAVIGDLLGGSQLPFGGGAGVGLDTLAPAWRGSGVHGEWEWALVIRAFADGAVQHADGGRFEFRMVGEKGCLGIPASLATVTLQVPPGHIGGTFIETPGPIGPWQASNGDLYFMIEPSETYNVLMMIKSSDGGRTWREVDPANRPLTDDLEGFSSALHEGTVHMLHQTSDDVWHHAFHTSDHTGAPDTWAVRDERLASPVEPPTQVAALAARSDGSLVAVYGQDAKLELNIRSAAGAWGTAQLIDHPGAQVISGPMLATGHDDRVHLAYTVDGTAWHRTVAADGQLGEAHQLATGLLAGVDHAVGSILPLAYLPDSRSLVVVYRLANGELWSRRADGDGRFGEPARVSARRVVQSAIDADQTGADVAVVGGAAHVLFIEESTGDVYHVAGTADGGWAPERLLHGEVDAQWVRGSEVRRADGTVVYGHVFDAGSDGGSGMNRYDEVIVD
ncbi:sialidase family protein [Luteimonas dalianensis]|uniref:sialidase family protein n=1 Tax=Luteimonas dalianensis TaxID=1148196 RepID=UPI003BF015F1